MFFWWKLIFSRLFGSQCWCCQRRQEQWETSRLTESPKLRCQPPSYHWKDLLRVDGEEEGECGSLFSFEKGGLPLPWKSWLRCFRDHSLHYSQETLRCWTHSLVTSVTQKCEDSYFSTWQSEAALSHLKLNADENEELTSVSDHGHALRSQFETNGLIVLRHLFWVTFHG